ncbi:hypothetical protein BCR34DRAFT_235437 [Clohesyomyces aquaticus]|uniref:Uncharacterized protein n=1 Tax=Clohesyomyces aquaticus TaxID=1231657 RepID=A0A1Y1Y6W5_9PLEO|nr:hypothetical protein BCR34DRAFT_235437 [Clohesyomyces aquaticus]
MFDLSLSQLLSSRSLFVSEADFGLQELPFGLCLDSRSPVFIYFMVSLKEHYASVQICVTPFCLESYPEQSFYSSSARYKRCCPAAKTVDFTNCLCNTAQRVYNSAFRLQNWNFLSPYCWKEESNILPDNVELSCQGIAAQLLQDYRAAACESVACEPATCDSVACEPVACEPVACEPVACESVACESVACEPATCESVACESVACEPTPAGHSDKERNRRKRLINDACQSGKESHDGGSQPDSKRLCWELVSENLDRVDCPSNALNFFRWFSQLEATAQGFANQYWYIATCILLIHFECVVPKMKEKAKWTEMNQWMKDVGLGSDRQVLRRRRNEAMLVSTIIASVEKHVCPDKLLRTVFHNSMIQVIRSACRSTRALSDQVAYEISNAIASIKSSKLESQTGLDVLGLFKSVFPDVMDERICEAIGYKTIDSQPFSLTGGQDIETSSELRLNENMVDGLNCNQNITLGYGFPGDDIGAYGCVLDFPLSPLEQADIGEYGLDFSDCFSLGQADTFNSA